MHSLHGRYLGQIQEVVILFQLFYWKSLSTFQAILYLCRFEDETVRRQKKGNKFSSSGRGMHLFFSTTCQSDQFNLRDSPVIFRGRHIFFNYFAPFLYGVLIFNNYLNIESRGVDEKKEERKKVR